MPVLDKKKIKAIDYLSGIVSKEDDDPYASGKEMTKGFEGYSPKIYKDTVGKRTVGYGFNLDDPAIQALLPEEVVSGAREISQQESDDAFNARYQTARQDASAYLGDDTFSALSPERQDIITDMAYNLGLTRLSGFKKMKKALLEGDFEKAAEEMKDSKWFGQVGNRSKKHFESMKGKPKSKNPDLSFLNPFSATEAAAAEISGGRAPAVDPGDSLSFGQNILTNPKVSKAIDLLAGITSGTTDPTQAEDLAIQQSENLGNFFAPFAQVPTSIGEVGDYLTRPFRPESLGGRENTFTDFADVMNEGVFPIVSLPFQSPAGAITSGVQAPKKDLPTILQSMMEGYVNPHEAPSLFHGLNIAGIGTDTPLTEFERGGSTQAGSVARMIPRATMQAAEIMALATIFGGPRRIKGKIEQAKASGVARDFNKDFAKVEAMAPEIQKGLEKQGLLPRGLTDFEKADLTKAVIAKMKSEIQKNPKVGDYYAKRQTTGKLAKDFNEALGKRGELNLPAKAPKFKKWFEGSKVVNEKGEPLVVYSGHQNASQYKDFNPKKSVSGGFYATANPEIASNYAVGKLSSSNAGDEGFDQYKIKDKKGRYSKPLSSINLTDEQIKKIEELKTLEVSEYGDMHPMSEMDRYIEDNKAYDKDVRRWAMTGGSHNLRNIHDFFEMMGSTISYPKEGDDPYFLRQTKNDFETLLDHIGVDWESTGRSQPGVFPIHLKITNPITVGESFPKEVMGALKEAAKRERKASPDIMGTMWTSDYPLKEWIKEIEAGSEYWATQIPKKAVKIFKEFGYDGLHDIGGKGGGEKHDVWIAFDKEQIRSSINPEPPEKRGRGALKKKDSATPEIPDLKNADEAIRFGESIKDDPEKIKALRSKISEFNSKVEAGDLAAAQTRGIYKEALRRIEGTGDEVIRRAEQEALYKGPERRKKSIEPERKQRLSDWTKVIDLYDPENRTAAIGALPVSDTLKGRLIVHYEGLEDQPLKDQVDAAASQAEKPTEAQKDAGNYKKGHVSIQGMDVSIEVPKGGTRSGVSSDGKKWSVEMAHHYGYIKRSEGADGENMDVFVGDNPESEKIFVIDQVNPKTGEFDEHKAMIGFDDVDSAKAGYLANYEKNWNGLGDITEVPVDEFKEMLDKPLKGPVSGWIEPPDKPPTKTSLTPEPPEENEASWDAAEKEMDKRIEETEKRKMASREKSGLEEMVRAAQGDVPNLNKAVKKIGGIKPYANKKELEEYKEIPKKFRNADGMTLDDALAEINNQGFSFADAEELRQALIEAGAKKTAERASFASELGDIIEQYEIEKDIWLGNQDVRITLEIPAEKNKFQAAIRAVTGSKKYTDADKLNDMAIQVYIDNKRNPGQVKELYPKLSEDQKKIVDLANKLPASLKKIADQISASYKDIGLEALETGVIRNVLDNYASRVWDIKGKVATEKFRKFGKTTRHAKQRKFDTIVEGWANGFELKIKGATNNLAILKEEIVKTIEDKRFIESLKKIKDIDGNPLLTTKQLPGYKRIEHPNFTAWRHAGKALPGEVYGRNSFVTEEGDLFEKRELYAPEEQATNLNNMLGMSKLKGTLGGMSDIITKYNAVFKAWVLQTSLFHHLAFSRSYYLGTNRKTFKEMNIIDAVNDGNRMIDEMSPVIVHGVRNGLTLGRKQDWNEDLLKEKTYIGRQLDKWKVPRAIKDKILQLREDQADFLFGVMGTGLKAKAYAIEYRNQLRKHPNENPDVLAKRVASLINDDFGGLHLKRLGRNPTTQHIFRLLALAPDWTESNIRTMVIALTPHQITWNPRTKGFNWTDEAKKNWRKDEQNMYQDFWAGILAKGVAATILANLAMAAFDEDDVNGRGVLERFARNFRTAWNAGKYKWLDVDITPIAKAFGYSGDERYYFSILGHFKDPFKLSIRNDPAKRGQRAATFKLGNTRGMKHKSSIIGGLFMDYLSGEDYAGRRFTTIKELIGKDVEKGEYKTTRKGKYKKGDPKWGKLTGQTVTWDPYGNHGSIELEQMPSFLINKAKNTQPVQAQQLLNYVAGETDGFLAIGNALGLGVRKNYAEEPEEMTRKAWRKIPLSDKKVSEGKRYIKDHGLWREVLIKGDIRGRDRSGDKDKSKSGKNRISAETWAQIDALVGSP